MENQGDFRQGRVEDENKKRIKRAGGETVGYQKGGKRKKEEMGQDKQVGIDARDWTRALEIRCQKH